MKELNQASIYQVAGGSSINSKHGEYILNDSSIFNVNGLKLEANSVWDTTTNEQLFDGSQSSFCARNKIYSIEKVENGHRYFVAGKC